MQTERGAAELIAPDSQLQIGQRTLVAAVYDGCRMLLYQDGQLVGQRKYCGLLKTNTHCHVWIGDNPSGQGDRPFRGQIHDVAVFDHALSARVIAGIRCAAEPPPTEPETPPRIVYRQYWCACCKAYVWVRCLEIQDEFGYRYLPLKRTSSCNP